MINIENEVFTIISTLVRTEYPSAFVTGENVLSPASFPCVSIMEIDNHPLVSTQNSTDMENHVVVSYEIEIYSNKTVGKKSECKDIASLIDSKMLELGFNRVMLNTIPNYLDSTIYRMVSRYRAVVSKDKTIYRRS